MSIEIELLAMSPETAAAYRDNDGLRAVWHSRYLRIMPEGLPVDELVAEAKSFLSQVFSPADFAADWPALERVIRGGHVPRLSFYDGGAWRRLAELFEREPDPERRAALQATFHGTEEPIAEIQTSYGTCSLVPPEDCAGLAALLGTVDRAYLDGLSDEPSQATSAKDMMSTLLAGLAAQGMIPPEALSGSDIESGISPELMAAVAAVNAAKGSIQSGDEDVELVERLRLFYATAAAEGCTVICGVV